MLKCVICKNLIWPSDKQIDDGKEKWSWCDKCNPAEMTDEQFALVKKTLDDLLGEFGCHCTMEKPTKKPITIPQKKLSNNFYQSVDI